MFWRKPRSHVEVLNDLDGELVNFYRMLHLCPGRLARYVMALPHSRKLFCEMIRERPPESAKIRRAARTWYLQKCAYSGKVVGKTYGYARCKPCGCNPATLAREFRETGERLHRVNLECLPWQEVVQRYDGPETLFYCDPPYYDMPYYRHNFREDDHVALAEGLRAAGGRFLLSYNEHPRIRELYAWARVEEIVVSYRMYGCSVPRATELIVSNF